MYEKHARRILPGTIFPAEKAFLPSVHTVIKALYLPICLIFASGCTGLGNTVDSELPSKSTYSSTPEVETEQARDLLEERRSSLVRVYNEWKGTGYLYGGSDKRGIDCSAFVQQVMRDALRVDVSRTTRSQLQEGSRIERSDLVAGDLVFFKTSATDNHVGVFLGQSEFVHSSSSTGVTISSLDNPYWNRVFDQARRIVDAPVSRRQTKLAQRSPQGAEAKKRDKLARSGGSGTWTTRNKPTSSKAKRIGW